MTSCADESAEAGDDGGKDADSHADKIAELMQVGGVHRRLSPTRRHAG